MTGVCRETCLALDVRFNPDKVLGDDSQRCPGREYPLGGRLHGCPGLAVLIKRSSTYIDAMGHQAVTA